MTFIAMEEQFKQGQIVTCGNMQFQVVNATGLLLTLQYIGQRPEEPAKAV